MSAGPEMTPLQTATAGLNELFRWSSESLTRVELAMWLWIAAMRVSKEVARITDWDEERPT
jgi:hypothetical protein